MRSCACNCVHLSTSMVQVGQYCAQLYIQMCTFVHKHGVKRHRCAQLCLQLCTVAHKHGADGAVLCAVAHAQCTLIVVLVPWVVGWAVRTYVRTYVFSFSLWSCCHGSSVGQGFLSRCGLGAMGRRLGSAFFLFAALVPWVVAWTMVSFSLWSWRHGSWAGQCFLCRGPSVAGWAVWIVVWIVAYLSTFGSVTYVRTTFGSVRSLNGPRTGHFFVRQFRPEDVSKPFFFPALCVRLHPVSALAMADAGRGKGYVSATRDRTWTAISHTKIRSHPVV